MRTPSLAIAACLFAAACSKQQAAKTQTEEQNRAFDEKYSARTDAAMKSMTPAMSNCAEHQGTQQAMQRLAATVD